MQCREYRFAVKVSHLLVTTSPPLLIICSPPPPTFFWPQVDEEAAAAWALWEEAGGKMGSQDKDSDFDAGRLHV
jgi:hypothetical protein